MADLTTEPDAGESAGALLRAARERQGLHIAALAAAIKVAPRKLDALENDRWHELPDATFVRALAQTVCRTLKIDARPVLQRLPAAGAVALEPGSGEPRETFYERPGRSESSFAVAAVRPMVWAAGALMAAAVAVYFVPSGLWGTAPASASASAASASPGAPAMKAGGSVPAESTAASAADSASASASAPSGETVFSAPPPAAAAVPAQVGDAAASAPAGVVAARVASATAQPAAEVPADARPAAGIVQIRSGEASWIEARDGRGQLMLSRVVQPGESVGLDGALPIRLTIGNAAATQLRFRGQPIDLAARARDNVARVELQ